MIAVGCATRAFALPCAEPAKPSGASFESVLPAPRALAGPNGRMDALYTLIAERREAGTRAGQSQVEMHRKSERAEMAAANAALGEQIDAENKAETWGTLAKVASAVVTAASAVAAVCSCGAASGLLVASVCLSSAAFAEQQFHVVTQLSQSETAGAATSAGLAIASAACSLGGTLAASAAQAGASAGAAGASAASATTKSVTTAASLTASAGQLTGGGARVATAAYGYAAAESGLDARRADQHAERMSALATWVMGTMKEAATSHERALKTLAGAMKTQSDATAIAGALRA